MGKTCTKCGIEFGIDNFHKNKGNKDGLSGSCKGCANERSKAWQKANIEQAKATTKKWSEANPDKVKAATKAWRGANSEWVRVTAKAWREANPEKTKAAERAWHAANPEKINAAARAWGKANPERTRQHTQRRNATKRSLPSTLTITQWENIKTFFDNRCCYCGEEKPLYQEHFVPLSKGGEYTLDNIICACGSCNSSKGPRNFFEWYPGYRYYSKKRERKILDFLNYKDNVQQLSISL